MSVLSAAWSTVPTSRSRRSRRVGDPGAAGLGEPVSHEDLPWSGVKGAGLGVDWVEGIEVVVGLGGEAVGGQQTRFAFGVRGATNGACQRCGQRRATRQTPKARAEPLA